MNDPIRARIHGLLAALARWRRLHLEGDEGEDGARHAVLDAFGYLGEAIDHEPRREVEQEPVYRIETVDDGRLWVHCRGLQEIGTSELVGDAEWLPDDPIDVTLRLPLTPGGQP
jgi:hypothetical protein